MSEGFKDFVAGAVLGESDLDDYLMSQAVMRFADAAARNAAIVEVEGQLAYLKDVDQLTGYTGSAWVILADFSNATTWTPAVSQSGAVPVTVNVATVHRQGKQVTGRFRVTCSGAGASAANDVKITLPFTSVTTHTVDDVYGVGFIYDASAVIKYRGILVSGANSGVNMKFVTLHGTADGILGTVDFTAALATSDVITGCFQYEASSASA